MKDAGRQQSLQAKGPPMSMRTLAAVVAFFVAMILALMLAKSFSG